MASLGSISSGSLGLPVSTSLSSEQSHTSPQPTSTSFPNEEATFPPMTTPWSTPISCTWTYDLDSQPQPGVSSPVAWLDLEPEPGASSLSCYPDGMFYGNRTGVFSPATCPLGWYTVRVEGTTEGPKEATTTAVCCSSEYSFSNNQCLRSVPTVLAVPISYNETASTHEVLNTTTTLYSAMIAVYTIQALFRESDAEVLGLTDTTDIEDDEGGPELSDAEEIGIAIGVVAFVLLAGSFGAWFFLKKRGRSRRHKTVGASTDDGDSYRVRERSLSPQHREEDGPPPPAYELRELQGSDEGNGQLRENQIRVLRAQEADLQRRIQELEGHDPGLQGEETRRT